MKKIKNSDPVAKNIISSYKGETQSPGSLESEVVMNELYSKNLSKKTIDKKYHKLFDYLFDTKSDGLFFLHYHVDESLKHSFGRCNFVFEGYRKYQNYIVEIQGVYFILSSKTEYIIPSKKIDLSNAIMEMFKEVLSLKVQYIEETPKDHNPLTKKMNNKAKQILSKI